MKFSITIYPIPILICLIVLCGVVMFVDNASASGATQAYEAQFTEQNQARLVKACPPPALTQSLERENLKKRLEFLNDANREMYLYCISNDGKVTATYVIKGKASSLNSYLTTNDQIVDDPYANGEGGGGFAIESPDLDGSYGWNNQGIFFFTVDGAYVEYNGDYVESSVPMNIQSAVELTKAV